MQNNQPTVNPYEEKLKRLLGQSTGSYEPFTPIIYIARNWYDGDWNLLGVYASKKEATAALKDPNNFDEDETAPLIDDDHIYSLKTKAANEHELDIIINALKNAPDVYWDDWTH